MSNKHETPGSAVFRQSCAEAASPQDAALIHEIADRADALELKGLCSVFSRDKDDRGRKRPNPSLHMYLPGKEPSLAVGFNWGGRAHMTLWRSVWEEHASETQPLIEEITGWEPDKAQTNVWDLTTDFFETLEAAYEEANS